MQIKNAVYGVAASVEWPRGAINCDNHDHLVHCSRTSERIGTRPLHMSPDESPIRLSHEGLFMSRSMR